MNWHRLSVIACLISCWLCCLLYQLNLFLPWQIIVFIVVRTHQQAVTCDVCSNWQHRNCETVHLTKFWCQFSVNNVEICRPRLTFTSIELQFKYVYSVIKASGPLYKFSFINNVRKLNLNNPSLSTVTFHSLTILLFKWGVGSSIKVSAWPKRGWRNYLGVGLSR